MTSRRTYHEQQALRGAAALEELIQQGYHTVEPPPVSDDDLAHYDAQIAKHGMTDLVRLEREKQATRPEPAARPSRPGTKAAAKQAADYAKAEAALAYWEHGKRNDEINARVREYRKWQAREQGAQEGWTYGELVRGQSDAAYCAARRTHDPSIAGWSDTQILRDERDRWTRIVEILLDAATRQQEQ